MPLHRGEPRPHRTRWELAARRRKRMLGLVHGVAKVIQMAVHMNAFDPILACALLDSDVPPPLVFSFLFTTLRFQVIVSQLQVCQLAIAACLQRRRLGAANSGGALPLGVNRSRPPRLDEWSDALCFSLLRFRAHEVWRLMHYFGLLDDNNAPRDFKIYTSVKSYTQRGRHQSYKKYFRCRADTAFMLLLCHMSRPGGYVDLQPFFNGMPAPEMSAIVNFLLLYLIPWYDMGGDIERLVHRFPLYASAIAKKGCPLNNINDGHWDQPNIIGFTDGSHFATCRPGGLGNHRMTLRDWETYNGHHRSHGINVLGINFPDGHVCLSSPFTGNRHDGAMWAAMGVYRKLRRLRRAARGFWVIFGDTAFPASEHCHKMLAAASEAWQRSYNLAMAKLRISAEWMFKDMGQHWNRLHQSKTQKLCGMNVGGRIQLAALLWNCKNSLHGSQTSQYFGVQPMDLRAVLGVPRQGYMPAWVEDA